MSTAGGPHHHQQPTEDHPNDASAPTSASSTPRAGAHPPLPPSRWSHHEDVAPPPQDGGGGGKAVRLMCSFGGRILPRPGDHQLRYVGGETRIVSVGRSDSFAILEASLFKIFPEAAGASIKYQLPGDDLDALVSVTSDEDVDNMMDEIDRLAAASSGKPRRLRLFLFPSPSHSGAFGSVLSTATAADQWFLDTLNSVPSTAPNHPGGVHLDRNKSEVSSVLSEMPDYLFGLDAYADEHGRSSPKPPSPSAKSETDENTHAVDDSTTAELASAGVAAPAPAQAPLQPRFSSVGDGESAWQYVARPVYYIPIHPVQYIPAAPAPESFVNPVVPRGYMGPPVYIGENYYEMAAVPPPTLAPLFAPPAVIPSQPPAVETVNSVRTDRPV